MNEITLNVQGMHCEGCERRINNVLSEIDGVNEVIADHNKETVTIKTNSKVDIDEIKEKIDDLGYEVKED